MHFSFLLQALNYLNTSQMKLIKEKGNVMEFPKELTRA